MNTDSHDFHRQEEEARGKKALNCKHKEPFRLSNLVLNHRSIGYRAWSKIINFLCITSSFIYAHYAAFRHTDPMIDPYMDAAEMAFLFDFMLTFWTSIED